MRRRKAFTLAELLVVVGVIALLIALLFPVLHKARQQAQQAMCASNMRQLGLAALMYAGENRGILPIPYGVPPPPGPVPYDAIGCSAWGILDWNRGTLWPDIASDVGTRMRIFVCPADAEPRLIQGQASDFTLRLLPGTSRNFSYGYTYKLEAVFGAPPRFWHYGVRLTQVRQASHKLLVMEDEGPLGPSADVSDANGPPGPDGVLVHLTTRHSGLCNVCCFDGHVELLSPSIFKNPSKNGDFLATPVFEHYVEIFSDQ